MLGELIRHRAGGPGAIRRRAGAYRRDTAGSGTIQGRAGAFARDTGGSVTIQVLVMSLLLLGTTGLVLDAGRAFSTHSQMQAYADQVALAAAAELDRKDDSIDRARAAALGIGGVNPFLTDRDGNGVAYEIETLLFLTDMPPQSGRQSANADLAPFVVSDEGGQSAEARFVAATVRERQVPSLLSRMAGIAYAMTGTAENPFEATIRLDATAIAGLEIRTCADMSTLVFCNPWEGQADSPFRDADGNEPPQTGAEPVTGRSIQYFAPNFALAGLPERAVADGRDHGSFFAWDVRNQLFRLTDPISDPGNVCSPQFLLALASEDAGSEGAEDYLTVRDRCLMARARSERLCFPDDQIEIRPATGPMVTVALNTIFDTYLEPYDTLLTGAAQPVPNTGLTLAQFFEPDALAANIFEPLPRDGGGDPIQPQVVGEDIVLSLQYSDGAPYIYSPAVVQPYEARPSPDAMFVFNLREMGFDPCHDITLQGLVQGTPQPGRCAQDFVGDLTVGGNIPLTTYYQNHYDTGDEVPQTTWYELYRSERAEVLAGSIQGSACLPLEDVYNDPEGAFADCDAPRLKTEPLTYTDPGGANRVLLTPGYERRKIRSAMVNCQAATAGGSADGAFATPIAGIVDVYIPRPPEYVCSEPGGTRRINCPVDEQIETRLWVELIGNVSEELTERYTAQLVR